MSKPDDRALKLAYLDFYLSGSRFKNILKAKKNKEKGQIKQEIRKKTAKKSMKIQMKTIWRKKAPMIGWNCFLIQFSRKNWHFCSELLKE